MNGSASGRRPALLERIGAEIRAAGPIPFARFMDLALHDPDDGYYARGPGRLGTAGDFFTASDAGTAFGESLARQLLEMDVVLGNPPVFSMVEFGAGRGLLARDVLDGSRALDPAFAARLACVLIDRSPGMREAARRNVPEAEVLAPEEARGAWTGCAVAVELFDALPVHRLRRRGGRLVEVFVDLGADGSLVERELPPTDAASGLATRYGAAPREGDEGEVAPGAPALLASLAGALSRGFVVIVDYGDRAKDLYGPARRRGTLLAYHRHTASEEVLARVGEQDLTAHVNFTQLEDEALRLGMTVLGSTTQDRFLIANGILRAFEEDDPAAWGRPERVRARLRVLQLIHPAGMGRTFRVLVLAKGLEPRPLLAGLSDPFR